MIEKGRNSTNHSSRRHRPQPMTIYVCGSSDEMARAAHWMHRLELAGIEVVSTWVQVIAVEGGDANPRDATPEQRRAWSGADIFEVGAADLVWMLVPIRASGRGAYFELGVGHALRKHLVASGDTLQSVFTAQALEFATDDDAFDHICRFAAGWSIARMPAPVPPVPPDRSLRDALIAGDK